MSDSIIKDILIGEGGCSGSNQQLRKDLGALYDLVNAMSEHVLRLDDTVTRLVLENAKQAKQLKNHERVWDRIDRDVQLFGNKVVGYELDKENEDGN